MSDKPHLFYNKSPCCNNLLKLINDQNLKDKFIFHDVSDPNVLSKLPKSYTSVPILIVKNINMPLIGKEVFNWLETQKYIDLTSNNILKSSNPDFYVDPTIGKAYDVNCASIIDDDDDKMNTSLAYTKDWNKMTITNNMNVRYIDNKISYEVQQRKLQQLCQDRNNDLLKLMNNNKLF